MSTESSRIRVCCSQTTMRSRGKVLIRFWRGSEEFEVVGLAKDGVEAGEGGLRAVARLASSWTS